MAQESLDLIMNIYVLYLNLLKDVVELKQVPQWDHSWFNTLLSTVETRLRGDESMLLDSIS